MKKKSLKVPWATVAAAIGIAVVVIGIVYTLTQVANVSEPKPVSTAIPHFQKTLVPTFTATDAWELATRVRTPQPASGSTAVALPVTPASAKVETGETVQLDLEVAGAQAIRQGAVEPAVSPEAEASSAPSATETPVPTVTPTPTRRPLIPGWDNGKCPKGQLTLVTVLANGDYVAVCVPSDSLEPSHDRPRPTLPNNHCVEGNMKYKKCALCHNPESGNCYVGTDNSACTDYYEYGGVLPTGAGRDCDP